MIQFADVVLLALMVVVAITVARLRNLFAALMVSGFFSLLSAGVFLLLDAVDVAFTEAAVGAGIATVLGIGTLILTRTETEKAASSPLWPLLVVIVTGGSLVYGTLDMPHFGDASAPIHQHVAPRYMTDSLVEIGVPNMVTSVLASYRSYDTFGETAVIFTAGIGVMLLLGGVRPKRQKEEDE